MEPPLGPAHTAANGTRPRPRTCWRPERPSHGYVGGARNTNTDNPRDYKIQARGSRRVHSRAIFTLLVSCWFCHLASCSGSARGGSARGSIGHHHHHHYQQQQQPPLHPHHHHKYQGLEGHLHPHSHPHSLDADEQPNNALAAPRPRVGPPTTQQEQSTTTGAPSDLGHEWPPLNETLRLLAASREENKTTTSTTKTSSNLASVELEHHHHHHHLEEEAATRKGNWKPTGGATTGTSDAGTTMRRVIVRELTRLIMDNEPEQIAANIGGRTPVSGQLQTAAAAATARGPLLARSSSSHELELAADSEMATAGETDAATDGAGGLAAPEVGGGGGDEPEEENFGGGGGGADGQTPQAGGFQQEAAASGGPVTCSPDYEDPAMVEAAASGGNLTAEQQQQLLAGADSSGLLVATGGGVGGGNNGSQQQQPPAQSELSPGEQQQLMRYHQRMAAAASASASAASHCIHPGSRMIAFITTVITPILFSVIIVVGLLGNIIVMLVILEDRKIEREMTPTNLLILDLSLADLSFIIFCIPFTGWDYAGGQWIFGSLWCKFNQYLIVVCALSSIYTLVLMSIDRFMAIVYPIECISYRTSKNMLYAIYIKWIIILAIALPTWLMHGLLDSPLKPGAYICRFLSDQYNPLRFQIVFFITSYLFPLLLIFVLYISLLNKLWFGSKPHGHRESLKMLESKKRVTWLVAGIVVVFALCWCPIQVMLILMRLKIYDITPTYVAIQVFAHTLGYMNSCINPIVYAFASENFHHSFKRSWLGRWLNYLFCCQPFVDPHGLDHTTFSINNHNHHHHHNHTQSTGNHFTSDRMTSTRMSGPNPMSTLGVGIQGGGGGGGAGHRNQSLNHIFHSTNGGNSNSNNLLLTGSGGGGGGRDSNARTSLTHEGSVSTSTLLMTPHHHQHQHQKNGSDSLGSSAGAGGASIRQSSPINLGSVSPLEPRDRPTPAGMGHHQEPRRSQTPTTGRQMAGSQQHQHQQVLIPRQPTASEYVFGPPFGASKSSSSSFNCPTNGATNNTTCTTTTTTTTTTTSTCTSTNAAAATTSCSNSNPPKQQLVARMVTSSSSTSNPQMVSHQCEPQQPEQQQQQQQQP